MRLKIYELTDPRTGKVETVFEYPTCLTTPTILRRKCTLVSREPLKIPILVVPDKYLSENSSQRESAEFMYALTDLADYSEEEANKEHKANVFSNKMEQIKTIFTRSPKTSTVFFVGAQHLHKKQFAEEWIYKEDSTFELKGVGKYLEVASVSIKDINQVFVTGKFESNGEVKENTQCKILISNN